MIGRSYDPSIFPDDLSVRRRQRAMPPRDELMKRNSFQSVNENKFLDALLKKMTKAQAERIAEEIETAEHLKKLRAQRAA